MSKIFDAIRRGHGEITDTVVSALENPGENAALDAERQLAEILSPLEESVTTRAVIGEQPATAVIFPPSVPASSVALSATELLSRVRTAPLQVSKHSPLLPFDTANWRASEQYRTVRTRILQDPRNPRLIAVSSAGVGDGKSVTAINIAGALSLKADTNILLMDTDFRRSNIHTQLSMPLVPGVTDILLNQCKLEDALIRAEQFPNFYILPAGTRRDNPSDLLETSGWMTLCEEVRRLFGFVIFDCPPIGAVSEYDLLQTACDGVIVVGRQDHTRVEEFLKAVRSVPGEKVIGVVMNCVSDWFLSRPYSSYDYPQQKR